MTKTLFAAAAALALFAATPARACEDCKNCPNHKNTVAQAEKAGKKDEAKPAACGCKVATKGECKCGEKCTCGHCGSHKAEEKKAEEKKS